MKLVGTRVYRFDQYTLEVREHRLKRGDLEISLPPKAFETLVYLVERHGHLVKKNELLDAVWADVNVTEGALTLRIKEARQALEDDAQRPRYIKTIPRIGYKFIADVEEITDKDEETEGENGNAAGLSVRDIPKQTGIQNEVVVAARPRRWTSHRPSKIAFLALAGVIVLLGLSFATSSLLTERTVSPSPIKSISRPSRGSL